MYRRTPRFARPFPSHQTARPHRRSRIAIFVAFAWAIVARPAAAQEPARGSIEGVVVDDSTNERRPAVTISVVGTTRGALTDEQGRFTIGELAAGTYTLRTRALSYRQAEATVTLRAGAATTITLRLTSAPLTLGAVQARARSPERDRFELRPNVGTVSLTPSAVSGVPALGEPDVLRTVQLLPGVNARNDFSSGYNVRGGESDQNLILLDGYPIYNPFHLGGLFSTFLDETVGEIELMTGGFGASHGSRLSSVLDVRSAEPHRAGLHGSAAVSVIASSVSIGSATKNGRGSWMLSGRRTYADKLVSALSDRTFPYHFSDAQLHAVRAIGSGNARVELTAYAGSDVLDGDFTQFGDSSRAGGGAFGFTWANQVAGVTLRDVWREHARLPLFGSADSVGAEQRVSNSHFSTGLDLGSGALTLSNRINELRVAGAVHWHRGAHERRVGYEASAYDVRYDVGSTSAGTELFALHQSPRAGALYYQESWRPTKRLLTEVGLRGEALSGRGWSGLSPRASAKYFVTPDLAVSVAGGQYAQWLHSLNREDIPVRVFDFWVASDEFVEVSRAQHLVLGVERWLGPLRFVRVEGWAKKYEHLLEQNTADDPGRRGDEFLDASGTSYGFDLLLRQLDVGAFGGWLSYTFGVSKREHDGVGYWPGHDRRHNVNLVGTWKPGRKYLFAARLGVASGTPFTDIVGQLVRRTYDPAGHQYGSGAFAGEFEPVGGARNAERYPLFQRLDLSVSRASTWRGMQVTPYFSVVNAYNAKNVFLYVFDYTKSPPSRQAVSQFPFLPSAGVTIQF
ncbi:MAG TPA: carboxypeptidase-like regulatory domain-containing protein [Gemmatimonadaceae bacterium]|nr:carboxypeptidase-like regulatory domain-containing protein [Gemmatimonadaceae bacterium]